MVSNRVMGNLGKIGVEMEVRLEKMRLDTLHF